MLRFKVNRNFKKFSKDKYVITDPGYIFDEDTWDKLIDEVFYPGDDGVPVRSGIITVEDWNIWYGVTAHGDGGFDVTRGGEEVGSFGVDAGMYAIIPFGFFEKYSKDQELVKNSLAVSLVMGGEVNYVNGDMTCGDISVVTSY